jgi:hypothetical protein
MPGTTEMSFSYMLPATDGAATLDIVAPANVEKMSVIVPDDVNVESVTGLTAGGSQQMGESSFRYYLAGNLQESGRASLRVAGLSGGGAATAGAVNVAGRAKYIAGIGAGLLLLFAFAMILVKSPRAAAPR